MANKIEVIFLLQAIYLLKTWNVKMRITSSSGFCVNTMHCLHQPTHTNTSTQTEYYSLSFHANTHVHKISLMIKLFIIWAYDFICLYVMWTLASSTKPSVSCSFDSKALSTFGKIFSTHTHTRKQMVGKMLCLFVRMHSGSNGRTRGIQGRMSKIIVVNLPKPDTIWVSHLISGFLGRIQAFYSSIDGNRAFRNSEMRW